MTTPPFTPISPLQYDAVIARALDEDLGLAGDITTNALIPADAKIEAWLAARQSGRIAGLPIALEAFRKLDPDVTVQIAQPDGADVEPGSVIAILRGPARAILTGERTALNILAHLSGIATATREAVKEIDGTATRIACTRKTTPGLRALEKYAVRVGGGTNHRFGLFDAVLIKDNHIAAACGLRLAIERARTSLGHMVKIEVEVDNLAQLREAMEIGVDAVLLDNMKPDTLKDAVKLVSGRAVTEASGGLRPGKLRGYAEAGVDLLSLGWLTHSTASLDVGLDMG
ncbi:carboxylating nicotinate-nucleotide diphosphorylase [Pelagibius sp. Alg239-R121]|uniref:carboxylating nicotinate-nucleotide diphosphorylase n=1 Tax=Pelagibius sp. Alg239-R121 TaxID=2993448 RepID=UPI0024A656DD|nr:carboxylating nicotinate-nucleotide diphosphorylase [Pelagibius sp. Alg239-R121]